MEEGQKVDGHYELVCPHCRKKFSAEHILGAARHQGFKCPHCRLFVPLDRASEQDLLEQPT